MAAPVGPTGPTPSPGASSSSPGTVIPAGTVWSTALLTLLRAPATPANYQFLNQWAIREHGSVTTLFANNPFFTTAGGAGTVGPIKSGTYPLIPDSAFGPGRSNTAGVPSYPNIATGVWINAYHIATEYPAIAAALRTGNPASQVNNVAFQSDLRKWSGGGYAGFASIAAPAGPVGPTLGGPVASSKVPAGSGGGGGGILGGVTSAVGDAAGSVAGAAGGALEHIPGVKQAEAVSSFIGKLTDPSYLLRGLQILAGAALVGVGVTLLAKQVALAADLPDPTKAISSAAAVSAVA